MTKFTERNLTQTAVYWGNPVPDGSGGYTYDDPIEIDCRWEDGVTVNTDTLGIEYNILAEVQVKQDLDEDGMLFLGTLDDVDSGGLDDPASAGAHTIIRFDKIPNLTGSCFYRRAYLGRSR
jgi:hypothetical protein